MTQEGWVGRQHRPATATHAVRSRQAPKPLFEGGSVAVPTGARSRGAQPCVSNTHVPLQPQPLGV